MKVGGKGLKNELMHVKAVGHIVWLLTWNSFYVIK